MTGEGRTNIFTLICAQQQRGVVYSDRFKFTLNEGGVCLTIASQQAITVLTNNVLKQSL